MAGAWALAVWVPSSCPHTSSLAGCTGVFWVIVLPSCYYVEFMTEIFQLPRLLGGQEGSSTIYPVSWCFVTTHGRAVTAVCCQSDQETGKSSDGWRPWFSVERVRMNANALWTKGNAPGAVSATSSSLTCHNVQHPPLFLEGEQLGPCRSASSACFLYQPQVYQSRPLRQLFLLSR